MDKKYYHETQYFNSRGDFLEKTIREVSHTYFGRTTEKHAKEQGWKYGVKFKKSRIHETMVECIYFNH